MNEVEVPNTKLYILPREGRDYQLFPISGENGEILDGAVEVTEEEYAGITSGTMMFSEDRQHVVPYASTAEEVAQQEDRQAETERQARIAEIKARMSEIDYDINACLDGVIKSKTEAEYRAERIELRNELRILQGKNILPTAEV